MFNAINKEKRSDKDIDNIEKWYNDLDTVNIDTLIDNLLIRKSKPLSLEACSVRSFGEQWVNDQLIKIAINVANIRIIVDRELVKNKRKYAVVLYNIDKYYIKEERYKVYNGIQVQELNTKDTLDIFIDLLKLPVICIAEFIEKHGFSPV